MSQNYDLIILGLARWDNTLNSSTLSIAKEFAKNQRVFYIDKPFSFKDVLKLDKIDPNSKRKDAILFGKNIYQEVNIDGVKFTSVTPRMSIPINFIPDGKFYDIMASYNNSLVSNVIKKIIKDYDVKNYVFFNSFLPTYFNVIPKNCLQPLLKVYRSSDDISQEDYIAKHGIRMEKIAVAQSDLVVASSYSLCKSLSKYGKEVVRIANAADPNLFYIPNPKPPKPKEIENLKGKIIMFTGKLSKLRIDYQLLYEIAVNNPLNNLVFVGLYEQADIDEFGLSKLPNIIFTGSRPIHELKNYLCHADCAIIPFLNNQLTESIYPLKINEYLALGLPVVSTNFSDDIRSFSDVIQLANSHQEFISKIDEVLNQTDALAKDKLVEISKQNTWKHRVDELRALIQQKLQEKNRN
jgi:glycosyltransferase involved in cell wall biosynthesis